MESETNTVRGSKPGETRIRNEWRASEGSPEQEEAGTFIDEKALDSCNGDEGSNGEERVSL